MSVTIKITYTNGCQTIHTFDTQKEADWYAWTEGDHVKHVETIDNSEDPFE